METKKKNTLKDLPYRFALCWRDDCEVCDHCLRHIGYKEVTKDLCVITHVNPLRVDPSAKCEFFRTDELATYAKGFVKMQEEMIPRQYEEFSTRLIGKFGRTGYYDRRRGDRLCTPSEIEAIRSVLKEIGLPDLKFDSYLKQYNFCD